MPRSSQAAIDLVVAFEVTSRAVYIKKYQKPEWPGVASGVTVGIGYDLGYMTQEQITKDWAPHLPAAMVAMMHKCAGKKGQAAKAILPEARGVISVPWGAAMAVFEESTTPRYEAALLKAIPAAKNLNADCFGVLFSLTYNRGASYTMKGDRYREMRNIRAYVTSGDYDRVPGEIRSMKRLWPGTPGLLRRRDAEAKLFEQGLRSGVLAVGDVDSNRVDTGDEKYIPDDGGAAEVTPEGNDLNVQPDRAVYNPEVEAIQRQLRSMNYHEVGDIDGKAGGKFVAGVAAFMTDRGKDPNRGRITDELRSELGAAKAENWSRPIAPARAHATAKDIQDKVPAVKEHWWQKLWALILGIPTAALGLFKDIFGDYNDPSSVIYSVKSFFLAVPSELYLAVIVAIAVGIFYKAKKAQDATVDAYRRGEIN